MAFFLTHLLSPTLPVLYAQVDNSAYQVHRAHAGAVSCHSACLLRNTCPYIAAYTASLAPLPWKLRKGCKLGYNDNLRTVTQFVLGIL